MGKRPKFCQEMKLEIVRKYLEGKASSCELAWRYGISYLGNVMSSETCASCKEVCGRWGLYDNPL